MLAADLVRAAKDGPEAVISRVARELGAGFEHRATRAVPHAHLFTRVLDARVTVCRCSASVKLDHTIFSFLL